MRQIIQINKIELEKNKAGKELLSYLERENISKIYTREEIKNNNNPFIKIFNSICKMLYANGTVQINFI